MANYCVRLGDEQKIWANTIEDLTGNPNHITIFARGSKANHNRNDNQMPATCITIAFSNQTQSKHSSRNPRHICHRL
jgi:hypothetical protein